MLGTVDDHVAKLRELEALGVDQFNIYLMHDAMEATLEGYGEDGHPRVRGVAGTNVNVKDNVNTGWVGRWVGRPGAR